MIPWEIDGYIKMPVFREIQCAATQTSMSFRLMNKEAYIDAAIQTR
jgi:hypothetical protein